MPSAAGDNEVSVSHSCAASCQDDKRRSVPHSEAHDATATARYPMLNERPYTTKYGWIHTTKYGCINTPFALNASVLLVKAVPEPSAENSAFHLPAHHVTSPDTSRGATQHARLKSVQSQNAPSLFPCAKSLRRRISSQIGWLTQNSEPSSQPADPRDGARDGLDAPAHRSAPGLTSRTRSTQRQVDISR